MQLNIAMLSVHSCPMGKLGGENTGGMSVYIRELCRELGRQGHMVDVYTRAHEPVYNQIVEMGKNARLIHLKAGQEEEIDKLAIYPHLAEFAWEVESGQRDRSSASSVGTRGKANGHPLFSTENEFFHNIFRETQRADSL